VPADDGATGPTDSLDYRLSFERLILSETPAS
jgi:hypothetical protein